MDEVIREIQAIKTQQLSLSNSVIENGKQNEMILAVLKELLSELREEKDEAALKGVLEEVLMRLDIMIDKLELVEEN
jgi:hypothetical protein